MQVKCSFKFLCGDCWTIEIQEIEILGSTDKEHSLLGVWHKSTYRSNFRQGYGRLESIKIHPEISEQRMNFANFVSSCVIEFKQY